jgi:two-component system cell cycle sensor histidine kinase/response regulator CckA
MTRRLLPLLEPLAAAFQAARAAFLIFDRNTLVIRHANAAAEHLTGRPAGGLVDHRLSEVLYTEPAEALAALLRGTDAGHGSPAPRVWLHRDPDQAAVAVRLEVPPAATEPYGLAILHPTEAEDQAPEDRLSEQKLQETARRESLGVLAGGIAHNFNNLLTGILGYASLARMQLPTGSPLVHHLEQIENSAHRAADLCTQMLTYAGKGQLVPARIGLNALIADSMQLLHLSLGKNTLLQWDLAAALPPIQGDPNHVRQVLFNLVINAAEALGDDEGVIRVATGTARLDRDTLAAAPLAPEGPEGDYVFLEVRDTGCGIPAETLARIFEPFFTTKFLGRGLGLAAVLGVVRAHRGAITVQSAVSRGSTFRVFFPSAGPPEPSAVPAGEIRWQGAGDVLVVDDEETVREVTGQLLEAFGFRVTLASHGREAVELFRTRGPFRFVLLDLTMPQCGGAETFRELRALQPGVPVILMSGYSEQEATAPFAGQGLAGFLQKPFKAAALLQLVRPLLERPT